MTHHKDHRALPVRSKQALLQTQRHDVVPPSGTKPPQSESELESESGSENMESCLPSPPGENCATCACAGGSGKVDAGKVGFWGGSREGDEKGLVGVGWS